MTDKPDPRGHLVRPYAVTGGNESSSPQLAVEALVTASRQGVRSAAALGRDRQLIIELCTDRVQSLAEIAARVSRPLGITRVLIAELVELGLLHVEDAVPVGGRRLDIALLERVLHGLQKL